GLAGMGQAGCGGPQPGPCQLLGEAACGLRPPAWPRTCRSVDFHPGLKAGIPVCHAVCWRGFGWVPASPRCASLSPGLTCAPQAAAASPAALATLTAAL